MGGQGSTPRTISPPRTQVETPTHKEETILRIPGATVHLIEEGEAVELAKGELLILRLTDEEAVLATVIKVGDDHLQWPLTRDEPVVKVDELHYLFSLPDQDGGFLNYGVSFNSNSNCLAEFDSFLKNNSCFPSTSSQKVPSSGSGSGYWSKFAPGIGDYNEVLAKAIAGGTGQVVKGIFTVSNAYYKQVQKGADLIQPQSTPSEKDGARSKKVGNNAINKSIRGVRKLSGMTEKMSKSLLNGVLTVTGTVTMPVVQSKAGKAVLGSFPGTVVLASLDAVNKVLDAIESAERKTLTATGGAMGGVVSKGFGEHAGEAIEDVFATTGHIVGTAWNIFKIRKVVIPSNSLPSSILTNAVKNNKKA